MGIRLSALLCAAVALVAEVYFLLWLQNWLVPGIDEGSALAPAWAAIANIALVLGFGGLHSVMARPAFKRWWTGIVSPKLERSIYLLVSGITLGALCLLWQPITAPVWHLELLWARAFVTTLYVCGVGLILWSIAAIDLLHFHGLRQAFDANSAEPPFSITGPYRWVRHPIQSGMLLAVWATPEMSIGHLQLALMLSAYSVVATLLWEERDLQRSLGERYEVYRRTVPALLPWPRPRG